MRGFVPYDGVLLALDGRDDGAHGVVGRFSQLVAEDLVADGRAVLERGAQVSALDGEVALAGQRSGPGAGGRVVGSRAGLEVVEQRGNGGAPVGNDGAVGVAEREAADVGVEGGGLAVCGCVTVCCRVALCGCVAVCVRPGDLGHAAFAVGNEAHAGEIGGICQLLQAFAGEMGLFGLQVGLAQEAFVLLHLLRVDLSPVGRQVELGVAAGVVRAFAHARRACERLVHLGQRCGKVAFLLAEHLGGIHGHLPSIGATWARGCDAAAACVGVKRHAACILRRRESRRRAGGNPVSWQGR